MIPHQTHFDRQFYQDKKIGYWISCDYPRIRAHRWVWINLHGPIPKGYHVHHKNEDKSDNHIENLELIEKSRHMSHHMNNPKKKALLRAWAEKIRPLTKKWHSSEEGKTWHRLHALKCNFGNPEPTKYDCQQCGKEYLSKLKSKSKTKFCSNACKSKYRRKMGFDNILKKCPTCSKKFLNSKYSKKKFCSKKCIKRKEVS